MFIDIHAHTSMITDFPFHGQQEGFVPPEQLIAIQKAAGIERAVLLPMLNPEGCHIIQSNEEIIGIAARYPEHFIPFCNIDPRMDHNSPKSDLSYIINHYREKGCRGIGEVCCNLSFTDPRVTNLFDHAEKCGMPVCFHMSPQEGDTYGLIDEPGLPRFEKQLQAHPELVFLCHSQAFWANISGDVDAAQMNVYPKGPVREGGKVVELFRKYPGVYGDMSAGSAYNAVSRDPGFGYRFMNEFQDKLCFGVDLCMSADRNTVLVNLKNFMEAGLAAGKISPAAFEKISHRNAVRLLSLPL